MGGGITKMVQADNRKGLAEVSVVGGSALPHGSSLTALLGSRLSLEPRREK